MYGWKENIIKMATAMITDKVIGLSVNRTAIAIQKDIGVITAAVITGYRVVGEDK
jgi:hypothetical protein